MLKNDNVAAINSITFHDVDGVMVVDGHPSISVEFRPDCYGGGDWAGKINGQTVVFCAWAKLAAYRAADKAGITINAPRCPKHRAYEEDYCPRCGTAPII